MKIVNLRKFEPQNGSKTVAFVDVITEDGIKIRSFRLANFDGRFQIQPPSRPATQKEKDKGFRRDYVSTVQFVDIETQTALLDSAVAAYNE